MKIRTYVSFLIIYTFFLYSCKKDSGITDEFRLKIGTNTFILNNMRGFHNPSAGYFNSYFEAQSNDAKQEMTFSLVSPSDSILMGTYSMPNNQPGLYKNIQNLKVIIKGDNPSKDLNYFNASTDFKIIVTSYDPNTKRVVGNFSGKMDGGYSIPGGFGSSPYSDIRTDLVEGSFNIMYKPF